ncbi:hypothetical protein CF319_g9506 [Tilletia indica]|nr:hypothetical protein CF319_g9506 [Tilletia indica]
MASIRGRTDYSDGKTQDDSVKDTGGWHLRTTGTAQTVRRDGETTGGSLTARTKVSIIEAQPRLIFTSSRSINPTAGADDMFMFFPILTISVHAISASVYRSGLVMPTILDRIHQALSAQLCNEEIFKGTVKKKGQGASKSAGFYH